MSEVFQQFNWIDVLVIILLFRTTYVGAKTGLNNELFKIIGVILGLYLGFRFYVSLGSWVSSRIPLPEEIANSFSFLILILIAVLILKLVGAGLAKIVKLTFADRINQWGGFVVGFVRGGIILSLIFTFFTILNFQYVVKSVEERSLSGQFFLKVAPLAYELVTLNYKKGITIIEAPKAGEKK